MAHPPCPNHTSTPSVPSCILFQSKDKTVNLIDIPRSLEDAQVLNPRILGIPSQSPPERRILSAKPVSKPFLTPEPKDASARLQRYGLAPSPQLAELMAGAAAERALATLRDSYNGPFCLARVIESPPRIPIPSSQRSPVEEDKEKEAEDQAQKEEPTPSPAQRAIIVPENSHYLHGTIDDKRDEFLASTSATSPFDLIVLDPPWPNRSAKRKRAGRDTDGGSYSTAADIPETRRLLSRIPVASRLAADGLVAIWITNKPSLVELLMGTGTGSSSSSRGGRGGGGLLAEWGLEVAAEWIWLKVTSEGEPLYDIGSTWRKPWERLILAKRPGSRVSLSSLERIVVAVPDLHSRKPNLRCLFEGDVLPVGFPGLEVFARNLTAGWWSWGDEVLRYQGPECWIDDAEEKDSHDNDRSFEKNEESK